MNLKQLSEPFLERDLEWKIQRCGKKNDGSIWASVVPYVTNRAIQERLDQVVGAENWRNRYEHLAAGGFLCGLSIKIGSEWVEKWDGAEATDIEALKGGLSNAMKRAAVQWGIGRFLYEIDDCWAIIDQNGRFSGKTKDGDWFNWNPPKLGLPAPAPVVKEEPARPTVATVVKQPAVATVTQPSQKSVISPTAPLTSAMGHSSDEPSEDEVNLLYAQIIGKGGALHPNYAPLMKALYRATPSRADRYRTFNTMLKSVKNIVLVMGGGQAADILEEITLGLPIDRKTPSDADATTWFDAIVHLDETGSVTK